MNGSQRSRRAQPMIRLIWTGTAALCVSALLGAQATEAPTNVLPQGAVASLSKSLSAAKRHARHVWRDTSPFTPEGLVNAYIEIPRGDRRKWEFDMSANRRAIDRVMPADIGGYPVNYGFVPQTISYDGDPFDALVLGPPLPGGQLVRGVIVGLMLMEDEKGLDSKVVLSPLGRDGQPSYELTQADRERVGAYFRRYKRHEPGKFSKVPGWGSPDAGRQHVEMTHAFFRECPSAANSACRLPR